MTDREYADDVGESISGDIPPEMYMDGEPVTDVLTLATQRGIECDYWHSGGGIWLGRLWPDGSEPDGGCLMFDFGREWTVSYEPNTPLPAPAGTGVLHQGYNISCPVDGKTPPPDSRASTTDVLVWLLIIYNRANWAWQAHSRAYRDGVRLEVY